VPARNEGYRLEFFADHNGSGDFDGIPSTVSADKAATADHAWRWPDPLAPTGETRVVDVNFVHTKVFTDVSTPAVRDVFAPAVIKVASAGAYEGRALFVRISETSTQHTVA